MIKRFCYETDKPKTYQQALDDFGITELLEKLSNYSDKDFDSTWMSLEEEEVSNLAAVLISSLTQNLNGKLIAQHLSAVENGNQNILTVPLKLEVPFPLTDFPDSAKTPRFLYGDKLRWLSGGSNPDWGTVIGRFYSFAPHLYDWTWCYQIWLSEDSHSAAWVSTDISWEQDLEPFEEEVNL